MKDFTLSGIMVSDNLHVNDIVLQRKGDNKFTPMVGVGIVDWVNAENVKDIRSVIQKELQEGDGAKNIEIEIKNKQLSIHATY